MKYFIIIVLFSLCSCKTVQKMFHKQKEHIDSTSAVKIDSSVQKHIDTSTSQEVALDYQSEVTIDMDKGILVPVDSSVSDKGIYIHPANKEDYFISYDPVTHTVRTNHPIIKVVYKSDNEIKYSNFTGGIDSSRLQYQKTDNVTLKKDIKTIDKTKTTKTMFQGWIWLVLILIVLLVAYCYYRYQKGKFQIPHL